MNMTNLSIDSTQTIKANDTNILKSVTLPNHSKALKSPSHSTITNTASNDDSASTSLSSQPEIEKVPTVFEWIGASESVYLTGSFCNWKHKFKMNFIQNSSRLILVRINNIDFCVIRVYQEANISISLLSTASGLILNIILF